MDIDSIADFIALADSRSFSRAAEARFVTQSAFSRRIQSLEASLDTTLVDRTTTPVSLTKVGERFLTHARTLLESIKNAKEDVQSHVSDMPNPVYLSMPHSLSVTFFPDWYKKLQRQVPDLMIRVTTDTSSRSVKDLRNGIADLAIILTAEGVNPCFDMDGIDSVDIGEDCFIPVRASHTDKTLTDILSYPKDSYMYACKQEAIKNVAWLTDARTVFESPSSELLKAMTLAGFGISILQESLIKEDLKDGYLVPVANARLPCKISLLRLQKPLAAMPEKLWQTIHAA
ncbi:MAG: LysR family transcriptional regulator [Alphaproteobacteria bacterium]|nr:LysR family transcriptional regulator [Alphaproteobacteria bacterium]